MHPTDDAALPVALDLRAGLADQVRDHVEGTLGWQVVAAGALAPRVRLVAPDRHRPTAGVPTIVVVEDTAPVTVVTALGAGIAGVLAWPVEAARLPELVREALAGTRATQVERPPLVVGGGAGGVGTTTVTMALAGLRAWDGRPTLVVVGTSAPVAESLLVDPTALAAPGIWDAATPVPGVPDLRAVRLDGPRSPSTGTVDVGAVVDAGVDDDVDVLVVRRDRVGVEAVRRSPAAVIVVLDAGIAPRRAIVQAAEGRPIVPVATSHRVARAHATRRLPAGLPGTWLAALASLVADDTSPQVVHRSATRGRDRETGQS